MQPPPVSALGSGSPLHPERGPRLWRAPPLRPPQPRSLRLPPPPPFHLPDDPPEPHSRDSMTGSEMSAGAGGLLTLHGESDGLAGLVIPILVIYRLHVVAARVGSHRRQDDEGVLQSDGSGKRNRTGLSGQALRRSRHPGMGAGPWSQWLPRDPPPAQLAV